MLYLNDKIKNKCEYENYYIIINFLFFLKKIDKLTCRILINLATCMFGLPLENISFVK